MSIEYNQIDWRAVLLALNPAFIAGTAYTGPYANRNQSEYETQTTWLSGVTKPTWAQIIDKWITFNVSGSGVLTEPFAPGDRKFSPLTADHGNWLYIDPVNGRTLSKVDYAMLYKVIGDTYASQYSGLAGTLFGLPKMAGRVPLVTSAAYPYGSTGGAASQTLTMSNIPEHNHSLDANIVRQLAGLTLFGLSGVVSVNPAGKIASAFTGNAGSASPTAISTVPPYLSFGNLFLYKGALKYSESIF